MQRGKRSTAVQSPRGKKLCNGRLQHAAACACILHPGPARRMLLEQGTETKGSDCDGEGMGRRRRWGCGAPCFYGSPEKAEEPPSSAARRDARSLSAPKWCWRGAESLPAAGCLLACPYSSRIIFLMRFGSARGACVCPGPRQLLSQAESRCSRQADAR